MRSIFAILSVLSVIALVSASDVLVLTSENFDQTLQENPLVLVEFYAPWCGHCKALAPEYEAAATQAKEKGIPVKLASVDADTDLNAPLRERFEIQGFPTVKFFRDGVPTDYEGDRTADAIVSFIKRQSQPSSTVLKGLEETTAFSTSENVIVIGFFDNVDSEEYKKFKETANALRNSYTFGEVIGDEEIATSLGASKVPSVVLFKKFDEGKNVLDANFDELAKFISANSVPLIDEIGPHNFKVYVDSGLPLAYLFVDLTVPEQKDTYVAYVNDVAKSVKGKLNWVIIDWAKYQKHSERLGLSGKVVPSIAIENMEDGTHYIFDESATLNKDNVEKWVNDFVAGNIKPHIKSEPIPENNNGDVKIVVADNFNEIVNDNSKDVFVEFYAPWCGHCKKLAPVFDQLGESLRSNPNIVIAKIDATANDVSPQLGIRGFPTLKFFKANSKNAPIDYEGDRSLEDMAQFIQQHTSFSGANGADGEKRDEL